MLDLSVVETVDSFLGRLLNDIAVRTRLLGAQTVVVGIQPAVAITLVELGLELKGVHTALNPDKGLRSAAAAARPERRVGDAPMADEERVPIAARTISSPSGNAPARSQSALGFGAVDQSRIATAVSELARNVVRYATDGRGEVRFGSCQLTLARRGHRDRGGGRRPRHRGSRTGDARRLHIRRRAWAWACPAPNG